MGYIALAVAYARNRQLEAAIRAFDLVFSACLPDENNLLLLIKACALILAVEKADVARAGDRGVPMRKT